MIDRHAPFLDTLWVVVVLGAILFNPKIGSLTPVTIIAAIGAYFVLRWERLPRLAAECWPLLLPPFLAIASALWSDVPATTARYGMIYLITILAAIILGGGTDRRAYLHGYFIAFAIYTLMSVAFGRWVGWGEGAGDAFAGLAGSKNSSGDMAGVAIIAALAFFFWAMSRRNLVLAAPAVLIMPAALFILWFSRATGALIATVAASGCLMLWYVSRQLPRQARTGIFVGALLFIALMLATQQWWLPPLFDAILESSGKDAGLTGRADLWYFADQMIEQHPWLGLGYNAFWLQDNLDAIYLWEMMDIESRQGFNFHNTFREILVHLGYVGLAVYGVVAVYATSRLFISTLLRPWPAAILASTYAVFFILKTPFEVVGFGTMHFATMTAFGVMAMGLRRDTPNSAKTAAR